MMVWASRSSRNWEQKLVFDRSKSWREMFFWFRVFWRLEKLGYSNLVSWMNVIATPLCSVILNKWARWSHLARLGLPAVSRKQNFPESHMINLLFTKFSLFVLASFVFCEFMDLDFISVHKHEKKNLANIQPSWPHTWSIIHIKFSLIARPREKKQKKWIDPMQKWLPLNNYSVCI